MDYAILHHIKAIRYRLDAAGMLYVMRMTVTTLGSAAIDRITLNYAALTRSVGWRERLFYTCLRWSWGTTRVSARVYIDKTRHCIPHCTALTDCNTLQCSNVEYSATHHSTKQYSIAPSSTEQSRVEQSTVEWSRAVK